MEVDSAYFLRPKASSKNLFVWIKKAENSPGSHPPLTLIGCAALDKLLDFSVPPISSSAKWE